MKRLLAILPVLFLSTLHAQIDFKTGSIELEASLNTINADAKKDPISFKADMSVEFGVSKDKIDGMLAIGLNSAEVYLSLEIAKIAKISVDKVVDSYKSNKSKGWGYIAKEMGIKPGSAEFHELKGKSKDKSNKKNKTNKGSNGNNGKGNGSGKKK